MAYRAGNIHHIRPRSRGGGPEDEVAIDIKVHEAWHALFNNDLVEEVIMKLRSKWWRNEDASLKREYMSAKMLKAWKTLFGNDADCEEAILIIKKMFEDKDERYLFPSRRHKSETPRKGRKSSRKEESHG